eukprot:scaffold102891_cov39-Prasinocladus_malaysianus.AAC.2
MWRSPPYRTSRGINTNVHLQNYKLTDELISSQEIFGIYNFKTQYDPSDSFATCRERLRVLVTIYNPLKGNACEGETSTGYRRFTSTVRNLLPHPGDS